MENFLIAHITFYTVRATTTNKIRSCAFPLSVVRFFHTTIILQYCCVEGGGRLALACKLLQQQRTTTARVHGSAVVANVSYNLYASHALSLAKQSSRARPLLVRGGGELLMLPASPSGFIRRRPPGFSCV